MRRTAFCAFALAASWRSRPARRPAPRTHRPGRSDRRCEPQRSGICLDQQRLEPAALRGAGLSGPRVGPQGAQRQGAHRRPDLGRSRRLHHHRRRRVHQEPGRRDRRRRLGRCAWPPKSTSASTRRCRPSSPTATCRCPSASPISAPTGTTSATSTASISAATTPRRASRPARSAPSRSSPPATSSQARQGLRDALAKECPDIKVVADEESGTNVEQVAANTAAIIQGHPEPDRHGGLRFRSGPGHRARRHRGRQGGQDHRHLERSRPRLPELDQGRHGEDDQHGEVRDHGLLRRPVSLHLPQRHHPQPRHGSLAAEPAAGDRRLRADLRHRGQCRHHPRGDRSQLRRSAAGPTGLGRADRRCEPQRPGICLDQQRLEPAAVRRAGLSGPRSRRARRSTSRSASPARPRSISAPSSPPSMPNAPRTRPA